MSTSWRIVDNAVGKNIVVIIVVKSSNDTLNYQVVKTTQPAFVFSRLTIETLEQGVKYVQS